MVLLGKVNQPKCLKSKHETKFSPHLVISLKHFENNHITNIKIVLQELPPNLAMILVPDFFLTRMVGTIYPLEGRKIRLIDHFTDTAAILNKLDLISIMGFPGGINIDLLFPNSVIAPFSR